MLDWHIPTLHDFDAAQKAAELSHSLINDEAFSTIFLYRKKFGIRIAFRAGLLFRLYELQPDNFYYALPLGLDYSNCSEEKLEQFKDAIAALKSDADKNQRRFKFILITDDKKALLEQAFPLRFTFTENPDFSDYIYNAESMASLAGKKLQKKRNHVSHFMKAYSDVRFELINEHNTADALKIEDQWFSENNGEFDFDKIIELEMIQTALLNMEKLDLKGGILYADGKPAAMTIGSKISSAAFDINFEKSCSPFDRDGAYTTIFYEFAKTLETFRFINREEDLGIEGLRRSKQSYQPAMLLAKWQALEVIA